MNDPSPYKPVLRDLVLKVLIETPNITAGDIGAHLGLAGSALYGLIGNLIKSKSVYVSGERYVNKSYTACYSVGASGPFALAPERLARKKCSVRKVKEKPRPRLTANGEMRQMVRSAAEVTVTHTKQSWLSALGETHGMSEQQITRQDKRIGQRKERRAVSETPGSSPSPHIEIPPWQVAGRSSLSD